MRELTAAEQLIFESSEILYQAMMQELTSDEQTELELAETLHQEIMQKFTNDEQTEFELPDLYKNWEIFYIESDEIVHRHLEQKHHYVRVARAIDRDHVWYGLLHIGGLSPVDDRYTGADRRPFDTYAHASAWGYDYLEAHPNGIDPEELHEPQLDYDWKTREMHSIHGLSNRRSSTDPEQMNLDEWAQ